MATDTVVRITDPEISDDAVCEQHTGWPVHVETECGLLAGIRPYSERIECSVCGQEWGEGLVSQHTYCRSILRNGRQIASRPVSYWQRHGETIEICTDN